MKNGVSDSGGGKRKQSQDTQDILELLVTLSDIVIISENCCTARYHISAETQDTLEMVLSLYGVRLINHEDPQLLQKAA